MTATVLQVNVSAVPERCDAKGLGTTGINKQPVDHPVAVRAPGPKTTGQFSGLVGDSISDTRSHGGDDQAVYTYAREDYDWWEQELDRKLPGGIFGENLTTTALDVNGAEIGETWRVGTELVLQVTSPRVPCATFQWKMAEPHWIKRFASVSRPGAYLRVVTPGEVRTGDTIEVLERPGHGVTVAESFHAWMHDPQKLRGFLALEGVPEGLKNDIRRRLKI